MTARGAKPKLEWIDVDKIDVDARYQRTIDGKRSRALIDRIAKDFHWSACQAILAMPAERMGRYVVLDGQHRVQGAKLAGIKAVPAVIVASGTIAEQAAAFVRSNLDRVAMNGISLYHARLTAEDPDALAVERLCKSAGLSIPRYQVPTAALKSGETIAIGSIAMLRKRHGERAALLTLKCVAEAFASTPGGVRAALLRAAGVIIGRDEKTAVAVSGRLGSALKRTNPTALEDAGRRRWRQDGGTEIAALIAELGRLMDPPRPVAIDIKPGENGGCKLVAPQSPPARKEPPPFSSSAKRSSSSAARNDDAAIAAPIAQTGVTRVNLGGAPDEPDAESVMNELRCEGHMVIAVDDKLTVFRVDGSRKTVARAEMLARANALRIGRRLQPWAKVDWERRAPPPETASVAACRARAEAEPMALRQLRGLKASATARASRVRAR